MQTDRLQAAKNWTSSGAFPRRARRIYVVASCALAGEHPQADAAGRQVLYGVFTAVLKFTSHGFEREWRRNPATA